VVPPPDRKSVPPVRAAQIIRAGSGRIWDALTTREGLEQWFSNRVLVDLEAGFIHHRWKDWGVAKYTGDARWDIEAAKPRRFLVFTWKPHADRPRTRVEIKLEPRGPITVVRLEETGFGTHIQGALDNSTGWGEGIMLLRMWVEHGIRYDGKASAGRASKVSAGRPSLK
jgi:uncharacterized protein YndB with AHSA1/START domain